MLERFPIIDTRDPEKMQLALSQSYGSRFFDLPQGAEGFRAQAHHAQFGQVGISYCYYGAQTEVCFPEASHVRFQISLSGTAETRIGNRAHAVSSEQTCLIPSDIDVNAIFGEGFAQLVLRIEKEALEKKLSLLAGVRPRGEINFDRTVTFNDAQADQLRRLVLFYSRELDHGLLNSSAMAVETEQAIVSAFLCLTHHNFRNLVDRAPKYPAPWQVHRAEAYIEANWKRPITVDVLCAETGASARSLFAAFNKARGYSPMAFLKNVRLKRAREILQSPDLSTSVTQTSLACGFHNLGHFAKDYRQAFGELPSETLAKSRARI